jgi:hypothetical protein
MDDMNEIMERLVGMGFSTDEPSAPKKLRNRSKRVRDIIRSEGENPTLDSVYEKCLADGVELPKKSVYEIMRLMAKAGDIEFGSAGRTGKTTPPPVVKKSKPKAIMVESVVKEMIRQGRPIVPKEVKKRLADNGVSVSTVYIMKIIKPLRRGSFSIDQIRVAKSIVSSVGSRERADEFFDMVAELIKTSGSLENAKSLVATMFDS